MALFSRTTVTGKVRRKAVKATPHELAAINDVLDTTERENAPIITSD